MDKSELQKKLESIEAGIKLAPANARPLMQSAIEKIKGQIQELEGAEAKPSAPEKTTTARGKGRPKGTTKPKKVVEKKGRGRPKKEVTPEVKPITETQINKVAKDIREEGEPMIRARKRAKKALVEIKDVAKDTAKMESKGKLTKAKIMAEIKKLNKVFANLGIDIQVDSADDLFRDATRTALPKGWRTSKNGKEYYENRPNRSDSLQNTPVYSKLKLAKGGMMDNGDFYENLSVYVKGKGAIYQGTSMSEAVSVANSYMKKYPNAEVTIFDEKYGDEYDFDGNMKEDYAKGGELANVVVYDNGGDSLDRYTIFTPDGSVYGMSENALGFNMYIGDDTEIEKGSHLGKKLKSVPEGIKKAVLDRMSETYAYGGLTGYDLNEDDLNDWFYSLPESSQLLYTKTYSWEEASDIWSKGGYEYKVDLYDTFNSNDDEYDDDDYDDDDDYAKGGSTGKEYMVFNYTDDIYASNDVFKTKKEANDFIKSFRKRYEAQGYYRDNRMNKIDIEDIDLLAIPSDFNPYKKFAKGGSVNYLKKWEVIGITSQGKRFKKIVTLGRLSDKDDVKFALKRMQPDDFRIMEITSIKEIEDFAKGGEMTYKMTEEKIYT